LLAVSAESVEFFSCFLTLALLLVTAVREWEGLPGCVLWKHIAQELCIHGIITRDRDGRSIARTFNCMHEGWAAASLAARFLQHSRESVVIVLVGKGLQSARGFNISVFGYLEDQLIQELLVAAQSSVADFDD
jgi:hypothetical protein